MLKMGKITLLKLMFYKTLDPKESRRKLSLPKWKLLSLVMLRL